MAKSRSKPEKIDPNKLKTRNHLMVAIICGATKSYVEKDQRREAGRRACRGRVRHDQE
jgi:hypothetical protein